MTPGAQPNWQMDIPKSWKTADWDPDYCRVMLEVAIANAALVQTMLADGTNIMGLLWPGGQRLLRVGPATGWALQEHFEGTRHVEHASTLDRVWRIAVESMVQAGHDSDADMVAMGRPPVRSRRTSGAA